MQRSLIIVLLAMQMLNVELTVGDIVIFPSNFYTIGTHQSQPSSKGPQTLYEGNPNVRSYSPYAGHPNLAPIQSHQYPYDDSPTDTSESSHSDNMQIGKRATVNAAPLTDTSHGGVKSNENFPRQ